MLLVKATAKQSPIEGIGLFAEEFIPKGTTLWRFDKNFDREFAPDEVGRMPAHVQAYIERYAYHSYASSNYIVDADNGRYLNHSSDPNAGKQLGDYILCIDDARFFNHSSNPNTADFKVLDEQEPHTVAIRDIQPGEEITIDYRLFPEGLDFEPK